MPNPDPNPDPNPEKCPKAFDQGELGTDRNGVKTVGRLLLRQQSPPFGAHAMKVTPHPANNGWEPWGKFN